MECSKLLKDYNIDCYIETLDYNKRYLTNFSGTTCEVILTPDGIEFITDGRYQTQVKSELYDGINIHITSNDCGYYQHIKNIISPYNKIGINGEVTLGFFQTLVNDFPDKEIVVINGMVESLRLIKTDAEINKIRKAIAISEQSFKEVVAKYLQPGFSERDIKAHLECQQILNGADDYAFQSIVASGENGAKPHADFSDRIINNNELVTIDFGCFYQGYCSDITRTLLVGETISDESLQIYNLVKECNELQIKALRPGVSCQAIDQIGRDFFKQHGVLEAFMHGTGHGIGLDYHEGPYLNQTDTTILQPGMIVTIEPGLYFEGLGGVRIEDDVLITEDGYEVLTTLSKDYKIKN